MGGARLAFPTEEYPYGYHRSVGIGYLCASAALLAMGLFILYDSVTKLIAFEHPSIGLVEVFGQQVWLGWLMVAALLYSVYSAGPPVLLGRAKLRLAAELHDKVLYADAEMNRADWMTALAAILGVLGIGAGLWWADAVAAIFISLDIARDGAGNVRTATADLMDSRPTTYDHARPLPLADDVRSYLSGLAWVDDCAIRLREEGHVLVGEAYVTPRGHHPDLPELVAEAMAGIRDLDWRLHDVSVVVVPELTDTAPERAQQS